MSAYLILFNVFIVFAFLAAVADHWLIGRGVISIPLRSFLLGCFVFTESYLAITAQPAMWLYVALNVWGLANIFAGRMSPLRKGKYDQ